jgi:hypothetical protein
VTKELHVFVSLDGNFEVPGGALLSIGRTAHSLATCLPETDASRLIWIGEARSRRTSPRSTAGQPSSTDSSGEEGRATVA